MWLMLAVTQQHVCPVLRRSFLYSGCVRTIEHDFVAFVPFFWYIVGNTLVWAASSVIYEERESACSNACSQSLASTETWQAEEVSPAHDVSCLWRRFKRPILLQLHYKTEGNVARETCILLTPTDADVIPGFGTVRISHRQPSCYTAVLRVHFYKVRPFSLLSHKSSFAHD